ncbi:p450 domain containing protein, partial [Asbolus verrucosus]
IQETMLWMLIVIALIAIGYLMLIRPHRYWIKRGVKQGNPVLVFGDNWGPAIHKQSFADMVQMVYNISPNSRYCGMYQFFTPILVLRDPDLIKQITVKDFDHFLNHQKFIPEDLFHVTLFSKSVSNFFTKLVKENIKSREKYGIVRPDMINLLLEPRKCGIRNGESQSVQDTGFATVEESEITKAPAATKQQITDLDITAQALVFFFGSFDSVSALMCFMLYELGINPDVQEKLKQEVDETAEKCNGKLTYEALTRMKYMDMVVSETLRLWPTVVTADRVCTRPYTIQPKTPNEKPLYLKKGTTVWLPIYAIQRDPQYFPDPERFDPERFSEENKGNIRPYTYLPFGSGPRNCIGSRFALLETKVLFFHILSHFEIIPIEKTQIPLQLNRKSFNMTAEGGFWFGFKRRAK